MTRSLWPKFITYDLPNVFSSEIDFVHLYIGYSWHSFVSKAFLGGLVLLSELLPIPLPIRSLEVGNLHSDLTEYSV